MSKVFKIQGQDSYEDDTDEGNQISKEEERERKKAVQARIRKEQAEGPPPDLAKRSLIFDSLSKIISRTFGKGASKAGVSGETRGTYIFTWGAGYHVSKYIQRAGISQQPVLVTRLCVGNVCTNGIICSHLSRSIVLLTV
jgi:hypothetical protein